MLRTLRAAALAVLALSAALAGAWAQATFPDRPMRLVIAFGPGGVGDTTSRLETLALIEPRIDSPAPRAPSQDLLSQVAAAPGAFNIILTSQPRGSIPTNLWGCSYIIFFDSL